MIAKDKIDGLYLYYTWGSLQELSLSELSHLARELGILQTDLTREEVSIAILRRVLKPEISLDYFREHLLEFLPQSDVISFCVQQNKNDHPSLDCSKESSWYRLIERDFKEIYTGENPKDYYTFKVLQSLIEKNPQDENSLWKVIEYVIRPKAFLSSNRNIRQQIWDEMFLLKASFSPQTITALNATFTRISNELTVLLWQNQKKLGSLYKFPDIIHFVDYIMSLGKTHYYLFREDPIGMMERYAILYWDGEGLVDFGNFFFTRMEPMYGKRF